MPKRPDEKPSASERSALVQRLRALGIPLTWLNEIVRAGVPRGQVVDRLIERLRRAD